MKRVIQLLLISKWDLSQSKPKCINLLYDVIHLLIWSLIIQALNVFRKNV